MFVWIRPTHTAEGTPWAPTEPPLSSFLSHNSALSQAAPHLCPFMTCLPSTFFNTGSAWDGNFPSAPLLTTLPVWNVLTSPRRVTFTVIYWCHSSGISIGWILNNIFLCFGGTSNGSGLGEPFQMWHAPLTALAWLPHHILPPNWDNLESCNRERLTGRSRYRSHLRGKAAVKSF